MLIKKSHAIAGLSLALSLCAVAVAPAKAQTAMSQIESMYGHPMTKMLQEMNPEAVAIGRIAGATGGILSVRFLEPVTVGDREYTSLTMTAPNWDTRPGDDIVLAYKDGAWQYVSDNVCEMAWISRLNLKSIPTVETSSIQWEETKPVSLPPVQERSVAAPAPAPEPAAPVRGMW